MFSSKEFCCKKPPEKQQNLWTENEQICQSISGDFVWVSETWEKAVIVKTHVVLVSHFHKYFISLNVSEIECLCQCYSKFV